MAENKTQQLPAFDSIDELVNFFDNHDFGDYLEELPEVDFEIDLKRRTYVVTLDAELADKITQIAKARHTSSNQLINAWVKQMALEQAA
jgi:translation initiation factor RLI1